MTFMKGLFKKLIKYTALLSAGAALTFGIMAGCSSEPAKRPSDPNDMGVGRRTAESRVRRWIIRR